MDKKKQPDKKEVGGFGGSIASRRVKTYYTDQGQQVMIIA